MGCVLRIFARRWWYSVVVFHGESLLVDRAVVDVASVLASRASQFEGRCKWIQLLELAMSLDAGGISTICWCFSDRPVCWLAWLTIFTKQRGFLDSKNSVHTFGSRVITLTKLDLLIAPKCELIRHRPLGDWLEWFAKSMLRIVWCPLILREILYSCWVWLLQHIELLSWWLNTVCRLKLWVTEQKLGWVRLIIQLFQLLQLDLWRLIYLQTGIYIIIVGLVSNMEAHHSFYIW